MKQPDMGKPQELLRRVFLNRKDKNPSYSLRAFARDLGMSQTLLSLILSGKRPVSLKQALKINALLGGTNQVFPTKNSGMQSLAPDFYDYSIEQFKLLSHWYHLPVLELFETKGFKNDSLWIARRLGISTTEARDAVARLLRLGLLVEEQGTFKKSHRKLRFPTQDSQLAVRNFHKEMIAKAIAALDGTSAQEFKRREICGVTLTVSLDKIEKARKLITQFQSKMVDLLSSPVGVPDDEVYQLNVQLFPLSKTRTPSNQEKIA